MVEHFDTGNEYMDDVFKDVGYGLRGGALGYGFAETTVMRSKFTRNSQAGILMGNFNALDLYVWYSTFEDCNKGITNNPGAGNYRVYNSLFKHSTVTDLEIGNTGGFSVRNNTSIGSNTFLTAAVTNNASGLNVQGNIVIDPMKAYPIEIANQGPLWLLDNVFRSQAGYTTGVVWHGSWIDSDTISVGNTFTVTDPVQVGTGGRLITIDDTTVPRDSLNVGEPSMPFTPLNLYRTVFEIPPGADATVIQQTLDNASIATGTRPVVHLPSGTYSIPTTLSIPEGSDLQFVGDDYGTSVLQWTGAGNGPVLHIKGPSTAIVRDLMVHGNNQADGIVADNVDQPGARIFLGQVELRSGAQTHLWVDGLDYAKVDVRNFGSAYMSGGVSVKVVGGFQAAKGTPAGSSTVLSSGASAVNPLGYQVTNGGQLLVRDMWYETSANFPAFVNLADTTGSFTLEGSRIALPANQNPPAIAVNSFRGKATFLTSDLDDRIVISGDGSQTNVLGLGMVGKLSPYFINTSSPAARATLLNSRQAVTDVPGNGSIPVANQGTLDPVFIKDMIAQTRTAHPGLLTELPPGVSDVRFHRVWVTNAINAIHLLPGVSSTSFDFSLANSGNISVVQGMQGTSTITASLSSGSGQAVSFSASGLPSGATAAFAGSSCTPTCTSTMTIQTSASTPVGSYPITVTGSGGGKSHTTSLTFTVKAPNVPFDFSLSNSGSKTVTQGQSVMNTVSATLVSGTSQSVSFTASGLPAGTAATFSPTPCNPTCTSTMTVQTAASTPTGSYPITVTGTAGTLARTTSFTLSVAASNGVDTMPPSVAITSPLNGGRVSRNSTVTITAAASDNSVVSKVEFSVNGSLLCTDVSAPYACSWKVPNRKQAHTISAKAYDSAGNTAGSTVQVTAK